MLKRASQWSESIQINSSPSESLLCVLACYTMFNVHLSNPDELYNPHLKLILLSHDHLDNVKTCTCISCTRLNGTNYRTSFANLHYYRFLKVTSRHTCSKFITTRLASVRRFCARCFWFRRALGLNDSLITIIINILKMHVINSGATTLISQVFNSVRKSAYFHD